MTLHTWPFSASATRSLSWGFHFEATTLSPDGSRLAFIQKWEERRVHVAKTSDGVIIASSIAFDGGTPDLAWSLDGDLLAVVSATEFVLFRTTDMTVVGRFPARYPSSVAFAPGGNCLSVGTWQTSRLLRGSDLLMSVAQPDLA